MHKKPAQKYKRKAHKGGGEEERLKGKAEEIKREPERKLTR